MPPWPAALPSGVAGDGAAVAFAAAMAGRLPLLGASRHPLWRAGMLRGSSVSLSEAFDAHATPVSSRPHPARLPPALLLPRARLAFRGCWRQRAFCYRGLRSIRSREDRTGCPIAGISHGAFGCPPLGIFRLA